ncbi:MAG: flagellar basal-body rod modification protein FlgD [Eubacteriaceae bacterium]|jgi:flagellar basal-body rod modification protein FlgD|nr:flagellar basal-body rod modification protein FlgD [Eubacteriaceae bacterium]
MAISSLNDYLTTMATTTSTTSSKSTTSANAFDMDDFLQMMVAQLQNQDMNNAADTNEFMSQMATYTMIESINSMTDAMADLTELSMTNYGVSLIGKDVVIAEVDDDGNISTVKGIVDSVNFYNGETMVVVDGKSYGLGSVMSVDAAGSTSGDSSGE